MSRPTYLSSFIGRDAELEQIADLLRAKSARLVTLIGPGGSGKTRLADEVTKRLVGLYEDGLAWVDLVGLNLPAAVPQAMASALNINVPPGQSIEKALTSALHPREMFVVLDNCEHVAAACVNLLDGLLRECPTVYVLATSRGPLGVQGEHQWPVPPMSHPTGINVGQPISDYDAVKLFQERAKQVRPQFALEQQDRDALIEILTLLDGQPLAIELAAARLSVLDLPQMAGKLQDQLSFLRDRGDTSEGRHQSMAAAIKWSHELLSLEEAILFRRLGAFSGTFSLEAAETVCAHKPLTNNDVLDLIDKLIQQSLLARVTSSQDNTRYKILESVRQYAVAELKDSGERAIIKDGHQRYFAALCHKAQAFMLGPEQQQWTQRIEQDYENIQAALRWAFDKPDQSQADHLEAARMVASLYWPWNYSERNTEAIGWLERALALPKLEEEERLLADLLHFKATFVWLSGDYPGAQKILDKGLDLCQAIEYEHRGAHVRLMAGILILHEKRLDEAVDKLLQSEKAFRKLGESRGLSIARTNLGSAFMEKGELDRAREYAEQAVAGAKANQDRWGEGLSLQILGNILHRQGDPRGALPLMEESIQLLQKVGQGWLQAEALWRQAEILRDIGNHDQAVSKLERCFELSQEIGAMEWQLSALASLGFIALDRGESQTAIGYFIQTFRLAPAEAYLHIQARILLGVVEMAAIVGKWDWAQQMWGAYQHILPQPHQVEGEREAHVRRLLEKGSGHNAIFEGEGSAADTLFANPAKIALEYLYRLEQHAPPLTSTTELRLLGLGDTEVYLEGEQLVASDWTFAKPKELLFYLATNPPRTKEEIGVVFWPEASPDQLRAGLRAALYHLRKALGERDWVVYEQGQYRFNRNKSYWYDLEAFDDGIEQGKGLADPDPEQAIEILKEAVSYYRGDFIADIADDDWAVATREELHRQHLDGLSLLSELMMAEGRFDEAEELLHVMVNENPLLEEAHRQLMRCYAARGEHGLVTRQYESAIEILQEELGVDPSQETTSLYTSLLRTNR